MRGALPIASFGSTGTKSKSGFSNFAAKTAQISGKPITFILAAATVVVWALTGPLFHYSDTWQLVINTGTTIITFLMVFLIQNTQNRDTLALQIKLDELIIAMKGADNKLVAIEEADEKVLEKIKEVKKRKAVKATPSNGATVR
jgi:low affinity Fe/Cu permease